MIEKLGVPASQLILSAEQTLYMVFVSLVVGSILAIVLAMILVLTNENGILKNRPIYLVLNTIINIIRSVPFIILMVFIMPLTKTIVGTDRDHRSPDPADCVHHTVSHPAVREFHPGCEPGDCGSRPGHGGLLF